MKVEQLFEAEANLRKAATELTQWDGASNRTPEQINKCRKALRAAALEYARLANDFEQSLRGAEKP